MDEQTNFVTRALSGDWAGDLVGYPSHAATWDLAAARPSWRWLSASVTADARSIYFEGKQQIFDELIADLNRRVRRAMSEGARRGRTRAEAERLGFLGFFRFTAEHPALYRIIRQAEWASPGALHRHYTTVAWALMGIGELIGMRWILWENRSRRLPDHVFEEMYAFILRGLGARLPGLTPPARRQQVGCAWLVTSYRN